jgi:hypothetical protein
MINCDGCERKLLLYVFRYISSNFLERLRKSLKISFRIRVSSNPAPPECETEVLNPAHGVRR